MKLLGFELLSRLNKVSFLRYENLVKFSFNLVPFLKRILASTLASGLVCFVSQFWPLLHLIFDEREESMNPVVFTQCKSVQYRNFEDMFYWWFVFSSRTWQLLTQQKVTRVLSIKRKLLQKHGVWISSKPQRLASKMQAQINQKPMPNPPSKKTSQHF